jgi:hypothetical protein
VTTTTRTQPSANTDHRTKPRRRGETLLAAIFDATLAELAEVGYARLAMERIAARRHHRGTPEPTPDTGSLREDVLTLLRRAATLLNGITGEVIRGLMAESLTGPTPIAAVRTSMFEARNQHMRQVLTHAADRGEIPATAIQPHLVGLAPALVDHHFLFHGAPIPDEVLTAIVDDILLPLLAAPPPPSTRPKR